RTEVPVDLSSLHEAAGHIFLTYGLKKFSSRVLLKVFNSSIFCKYLFCIHFAQSNHLRIQLSLIISSSAHLWLLELQTGPSLDPCRFPDDPQPDESAERAALSVLLRELSFPCEGHACLS